MKDIRLLEQVRIDEPCPLATTDLPRAPGGWHCPQCDKRVHDIGALTRDQAEDLLRTQAGAGLCVRITKDARGVVTRERTSWRALRRGLDIVRNVAAAIGLTTVASTIPGCTMTSGGSISPRQNMMVTGGRVGPYNTQPNDACSDTEISEVEQ